MFCCSGWKYFLCIIITVFPQRLSHQDFVINITQEKRNAGFQKIENSVKENHYKKIEDEPSVGEYYLPEKLGPNE